MLGDLTGEFVSLKAEACHALAQGCVLGIHDPLLHRPSESSRGFAKKGQKLGPKDSASMTCKTARLQPEGSRKKI